MILLAKKVLKNCSKSLKWFSNKRIWYIAKNVIIISILSLLFFFLLVHHIVAENNVFSLIANFSLNYSFVLVPALLYLIEVRRNFRKKFDNIFSLKDSLIYLRSYIARRISGHKSEAYGDLIIDPSKISQLIRWLRNFKFYDHATFFLSHIQRESLYHLDIIIIDVIRKIKKYDSRKDFERMEQNSNFKSVKLDIEKLLKIQDINSLKNHFLADLTFPLVYSLLLNKPNHELAIYYYITEKLSNEIYQKIIDSVLNILKYNIKSEGREAQEFSVNIVKAIETLTRNQKDLLKLGIKFGTNLEKDEYTLIIFDEPCDLLTVKIKMDNTFKVNTRYDSRLKEAEDWVKQNMLAYLQRKIEKFNLKLEDSEFWIQSRNSS